MSRWTPRLTSLRLEDAAGLGLTVTPTVGDFAGGEENAENAEHVATMDRMQHDGFVLGNDLVQAISFSLEMKNQKLTDASLALVNDFVKRRGSFAAPATQSVDPTIWAWKAIATFSDGTTTTTKTYPKCEGGIAWQEGAPSNTFKVSANNHLAPVDA